MGGALLVERRLQLGGLGGGVAAVLAEGLAQLLQLTRVALTVRLDLPCAVLALRLELAGQAAALLLGRGTILALGLELLDMSATELVELGAHPPALGVELLGVPGPELLELGDVTIPPHRELGAHPVALGRELLGVAGTRLLELLE